MSSTPRHVVNEFAAIRADYEMSRASRFVRHRTGTAPLGGGEDWNYREETRYYRDIEQARDMDRNDGLVGTLADRRVDNIVQQGFTLDTKTGDKKLDQDLWHRWQAFANDPEMCDIAGEMTFHEMERHVCRSESIDGDIIGVGTEDGPLQLHEAHAVQTSTKIESTFLGVTRDQYGKRTQYHVRYDLNQFATKSESIPIDVRNSEGVRQLFHVYNPKRISATRGVTQLAPVFSLSGMLEDINFAKLVQQQAVSCFAILSEKAVGSNGNLPNVDRQSKFGEPSTEQTGSGVRNLEGVSPGMFYDGREGETLKGFSPNIPNSEYFQQVKLILQIVGVNFGLPLCLILMDGSETNFSGWRGAVDEARKGFVADQLNLVRRWHSPVYRWWLHREMAMEPILQRAAERQGIDIFGHAWQLPTWSYIEPVADAEGDTAQLRNALTSPRRMHAARGKDWETIAEEIIDDNVYAIEKAQAKADSHNQKFPKAPPLSWRDLIPLPMPEGQTLAMQDPNAIAVQEEAANAEDAEQPPQKPQAKAKKKVRAQSESMKESLLQAEILLHIYGDDAEEVLFGSGPQAAFDEKKIKRDEKGRFASKGSEAALQTAKESLSKALQGDRTKKSARQLSDHLENLTVKQLTELKKEYGIKASGPTKQALIEKLADRLDRGRRTPQTETEEKPAEKKNPAKEKKAPNPATEQDADKFWSQQTPEQQRQTFRESLVKEVETARSQLWKAQDAHVMAVTKEQVVVRDIDRQTMRLAKAQAKLARKPDDEKAKNEARIAQQKLSDLESKLAPLRSEMQRTNEARQQAREHNDTVVSRMMSGYIDRVNGTVEAKKEAADKLAAVKQMHSSGEQITAGKSWLQLRGFGVEETYKTSLEIAATENVTAERKKGEQILTGLANARFHAQAMSHPIVYEKNVRAYAQKGGIVALSQSDGANTYLHEFGHHIEHDNKQADKLLTGFLNKRVGSEPTTKLAEKFPDSNYDDSEVGRKDDFVKTIQAVYDLSEKAAEKKAYYIGKKYMSGATEIMSMGIEMLSRNAEAFAKSDPEYFDLITGILSGQMLESKP